MNAVLATFHRATIRNGTMSKDIEGFIRGQQDLFGRIARAFENLKKTGIANIILGLVEARLQALETKFDAQQERLFASFWHDLAEHDYLTKNILCSRRHFPSAEGRVPRCFSQYEE